MTQTTSLTAARDAAREVRGLYEVLEERFNGTTWTLHELMLGFSNDVGTIGRLILARDGTWPIDEDPRAELEHKLAESVWWTFVLADRLGIDLDEAYGATMATIRSGLEATIARSAPPSHGRHEGSAETHADRTTMPSGAPDPAASGSRLHVGKVALVTGGARGIGAGIVRRLADDGAHVVFTYATSATSANELVAEIESAGGSGSAIAADSSRRDEVRRAVETVLERHGRLDIVVGNAGGGTIEPLAALRDDEIDRMIDVNIRGTLDLIRCSAPHMSAGGRIITIGSVTAGFVADDSSSVYAMTKGAVASLVQGLARELGPRGITVNNVQPGPVDTDANPADGPAGQTLRDRIPVGRFGTAREVAALVSYVASDDAAFINGASLDVDGGYSA